MKMKIKRLRKDAIIPTYAHSDDAGMDLYAVESVELWRNEPQLIPTGISVEIPEGYFGLMRLRSGLSSKYGVVLASSGVVDSGYRGEWLVGTMLMGQEWLNIQKGERIAQVVILPYVQAEFEEVEELSETLRGVGGHGSTGR